VGFRDRKLARWARKRGGEKPLGLNYRYSDDPVKGYIYHTLAM